jgi:hypothetical protein
MIGSAFKYSATPLNLSLFSRRRVNSLSKLNFV